MNWPLFLMSLISVGSTVLLVYSKRISEELARKNKALRNKVQDLVVENNRLLITNSTIEFRSREKERERIAANLHDELGASLTAIKYNLESVSTQNV